MAEKFSDILTYVLSLALAAGVIAFAAYKVVMLNAMDNPPANLGLNFPAPRRKVIMEAPQGGDMLTTQSLGEVAPSAAVPEVQGGLVAYELLTVVDGVAFVAVNGDAGKTLVPVTIGSRLPGGPSVSGMGRSNGRWWLTAGSLRVEQGLPAQ
jgi:hypothetical protein